MSLDKLHQLVGSLTKAVEDNQKLATPILAAKLSKCSESYPGDQTLGSMARIIKHMSDNNTLFIRRSELKSLYNKLYSNNSKFAELFQEELGQVPMESNVTHYVRDEAVQANPYHVGDQVLANALESVFDRSIPVKMYSQPVADKAIKSVVSALEVWNLRPTKLAVSDGNDKFIVIKADYDTPKGVTSFYVPVEVNKNDIAAPEVFMGNAGPQDLNHLTIKSYLTQQAGSKLKVNGTNILGILTTAASEHRNVSDAELAVTRLNAIRQGKSEFFEGQIIGLKVEASAELDVELPKSDEFLSFEEQFSSPQGVATWQFGEDKVTTARNNIVRELSSFGFSRPQVVVTGHDERTLFYGVSLDSGKVAFTVPVKITEGKLNKPSIILCNGSIATFDKEGINQLVSENRTDIKVAAAASTMSSLKPSEVINDLRAAVADGNHAKAEDALNVLAGCGDQKAYATGFQVYMSALAGDKITETKCSKMMKSAVSEYPVCSHTGLPVNKVYQDKDGHCRPLFRKGMDETYEGATFINAKIFG